MTILIGAYWGKRQETLEQAADRATDFLLQLGEVHPFLQCWHKKGMSSETSQQTAVTIETLSLTKLFVNQAQGLDGSEASKLGHRIAFWNGLMDFPSSISIGCGSFAERVGNAVALKLPPLELSLRQLSENDFERILSFMISHFDPDFGLVSSHDYRKHQGGGTFRESGGWFVYEREKGIKNLEVRVPFGGLDAKAVGHRGE